MAGLDPAIHPRAWRVDPRVNPRIKSGDAGDRTMIPSLNGETRLHLIVGAGGAGSAVALALIEAGVSKLTVADVDAERRGGLVKRLATRAPAVVWGGAADAAGFNLIVNATPTGMKASDPLPVDAARLE